MAEPLRIGVNALYLIPGGVGGTEIYLRGLLEALAGIDSTNGTSFSPIGRRVPTWFRRARISRTSPQPVRAASRPARILWEQTALPLAAVRCGWT